MSNAPPPPPPGYGQQPGGYGQPSPYGGNQYGNVREHPDGTTVLVLGILSLVVCGVLGPFAWAKGNTAKKEMDAQPGVMWSNRGSVTAGRICGMVASILIIAMLVIFVFAIILIAVSSGANSS